MAEAGGPSADQGAGNKCDALGEPYSSDAVLELVAVAGLLQHGVVDDGVHRSGAHGEDDAEHQRAQDVGRTSVLRPPISAQDANAMLAPISTPRRPHRSARSPRHLEEGHHGGVGGGHHSDGRCVQADLVHDTYTMGDEATYAWVLEGRTIRVSLGDQDSNTYFQATLNEDNSQYVGTWHYPEGGPPDANETIVYTRVDRTS